MVHGKMPWPSGKLIGGGKMKWNKYIPAKVEPKKVYDKRILRPMKTSLVKKVFRSVQRWIQSRVTL